MTSLMLFLASSVRYKRNQWTCSSNGWCSNETRENFQQ